MGTGLARLDPPSEQFTAGRYVIAWCNAVDARDPILLQQQTKLMREGFERAGHKPALVLIVVADAERDAAVARIEQALDPPASSA